MKRRTMRYPNTEASRAARLLAGKLMARWGLVGWDFAFNGRKRQSALCRWPTRGLPGRIELSWHYVQHNPPAAVADSILHEIAHAVSGDRGHGEEWKKACKAVGANPSRCREACLPSGRHEARCVCGQAYHRHRRPRASMNYHCVKCGGGPLVFTEVSGA